MRFNPVDTEVVVMYSPESRDVRYRTLVRK
jgi:hypothetical protein